MSGLVLDKVEAGYGETIVLEDVSLALPPGGTLAVLGRNGVGKTTLVATIMGHARLHARQHPVRRHRDRAGCRPIAALGSGSAWCRRSARSFGR